MADPVADLTGTTVGRFTVRVRLGAGGMGEVYRADDTKLKRSVALKRMAPHLRADARYRQRFLKEAERASRLTDQHIAGLYDVLEEGGETFLVMEYVEGETLRQRLARPLPIEEFLAIAGQCAEALVAAHQKDIVHRDLKPENIMLTPAGQVKVLDFGVAKRLPRPDETADTAGLDSVRSTAGGLSGTPAYMAPETLLEKEADGRADIFSLGVVFYEALTGRHPFRAASFVATSDRILRESPAPLLELNPRVPAELERIVAKMLAKRPDQRYQTAADLLVDLRALAPRGRRELRPSPLPIPEWHRRRRKLLAAGSVLAILAALLLIPSGREKFLRWTGWSSIPEQKHLAVLPFENVSGDAAGRAFCEGLTYTLTSKLTQLEQFHGALLVVPTSEVMRGRVKSVEEARDELAVNLVLTGSVQRAGNRIRLNASLVDARSRRQLRSLTLDADLGDPAQLQDGVVLEVARLLELELRPEVERVLAAGRTGVAPAYDLYLQGRGYLQDYETPGNIERAITALRRALELDPKYALAYAGLGEAYLYRFDETKDARWVKQSLEACQRAVELDDALAVAHATLGRVHRVTGKYEQAVAEFQRALELDPRSDEAYRGLAAAYEALGQAENAERTYRRAIELRPDYGSGYQWLGAFYYRQGRHEEAIRMFQRGVELAPGNSRAYSNLGGAYWAAGRYDKARVWFERSLATRPNYRAYNNLGTLYFFQESRYADAARMYEKALALDDRDYRVWSNLAAAYRWTPGEQDKARAAYERAARMAEEQRNVNPRDPHVLVVLADCYAMLGQAAKARTLVQQALALAPGEAEVMFRAGDIYEELGDRERALEWIGKALARGYSRAELERAPGLAQLRADARYPRLLERLDTKP